MYHIFFIHSSVDGHLDCFHTLAIVSIASINNGGQISFWISDLLLKGRIWQKLLCVTCEVKRQRASSLYSLVISAMGKPTAKSWGQSRSTMELPWWSNVKNLPAMQVRFLGQGRFLREGNGYPFQYSCLENSMDRGTWQVLVHGLAKSQTWLTDFNFQYSIHTHTQTHICITSSLSIHLLMDT